MTPQTQVYIGIFVVIFVSNWIAYVAGKVVQRRRDGRIIWKQRTALVQEAARQENADSVEAMQMVCGLLERLRIRILRGEQKQ